MATVDTARSVVIPPEVLQSIGKAERDLKIELAIFFYKKFQLSAGKAADFAGISRVAFWRELGKRGVPVNYDESDAAHDTMSINEFNDKFPV